MMSGKEDVVLALLDHGAQIDARDKEGEQPIHYAAAENNEAMILLLVDAGTKFSLLYPLYTAEFWEIDIFSGQLT